jgi:hypothetical protein
MSDLEFQRELSPEQIREALSLLDSRAGAQNQNLRVGDLNPDAELDHDPNQPSSTMAAQDHTPAAEDLRQRRKHGNLAVAFYGVGIAAAGALAVLSWSESALTPPPLLGITHEQLANQQSAPTAKSVSPALPVIKPLPDQSRGELERQPFMPEVAGSGPIGYANRDSDQAALKDTAKSDNAIPSAARSATIPAIGTTQAQSEERASRKLERESWHARAVRVTAAKKRSWRRHWQARAEIGGKWCFFGCFPWRTQRIFYEPPRSATQ